MTWKPIETAPKDREILLYSAAMGQYVGKWVAVEYGSRSNLTLRPDHVTYPIPDMEITRYPANRFRPKLFDCLGCRSDSVPWPSHWMPIPEITFKESDVPLEER